MLVVTACLMALGVVAYAAFALGMSTGRDNSPRLSAADLARTASPRSRPPRPASRCADYARLCSPTTPRRAPTTPASDELARYVSGGTDPRCGWNGEGSQSVVDATWTGDSEPIDVPGLRGNARMMTVRVLTDSGSSRIVTVPVYVADLANANGMRIVGDIGEMPQPNLAAAPEVKPPAATDSRLSEALTQGQFFEQFFTAWGARTGGAAAVGDAGRHRTHHRRPQPHPGRADHPGSQGVPAEGRGPVGAVRLEDQTDHPGLGVGGLADTGRGVQDDRDPRLPAPVGEDHPGQQPDQEWACRHPGGIPDVKGG